MKAIIRLVTACLLAAQIHAGLATASAADVCAAPGRDGIGVSITGVVNTYWGATASVSAGATTIPLGQSAGATAPIAAGDLLLVIQMQDAQINTSNSSSYGDGVAGGGASGVTGLGQSGVYEFVRAANGVALTGGSLQITASGSGLANAYTDADANIPGGRGQRRFQVIRVPQYSNASLGAGLTAYAWDGSRGGVLAIDVAARLDLAGGVADVSGRGFRGGGGRKLTASLGALSDIASSTLLSTHASKGEGIAGTPEYVTDLLGALLDLLFDSLPGGSSARGAPGNAGGGGLDGPIVLLNLNNIRNSGGGGGSGYGNGGGGGHASCNSAPNCGATAQNGGYGGTGVTAQGAARVLFGGGGGAGSNTHGSGGGGQGIASSGAPGGGIVIVRAGVVAGTGSFLANGAAASDSVANDGSGGGGGGGSILFLGRQLEAGASLLTYAKGGKGGNNTGGGDAHGPGGGGGGGFIASALSAAADVSGGANGTTVNGGAFGAAYGATSGLTGSASTGLGLSLNLTGLYSGYDCTPIIEKLFETATITLGMKTRLKVTLTNNNTSTSLTGGAFVDTYPSGMVNAPVPDIATTCGGTVTAAAGANTLQVINATVSAAASCSVWIDVLPQHTGAFLNTINAEGLVGALVGSLVKSLFPAEDNCEVIEPLAAVKSATTLSDPANGATNPKSIPGAVVEYAIAVTNPTGEAVGNVVVGDAVPANANLIVSDIGAAGSGPVSFAQGSPSSTLTYTFTSLSSAADDLEFSNDNGSTWTYSPAADVGGVDAAVTNVRAKLAGSDAAGGKFTLKFRVKLE